MKKLFALLISFSMLLSVVPMVSYANDTKTLDELIGNELANGTFEADITGWTASDGVTITSDMINTSSKSAKSMKIQGAGSITAPVKLYQQEAYDVSLWVKPVDSSVTVTVKIGDKVAFEKIITGPENLSEKVKMDGSTGNGAVISAVDTLVSVAVTDSCYIDDVVVKQSEEKALNAVSADNLGGWTEITGNGDVSYDTTKSALKLANSYNARAVQYIAVDKPGTYTISANVYLEATNASNKALKVYWSSKDATRTITKAEVFEKWTPLTWTIENAYPTDGTKAGIYFAIGGNGSSAASTFYIKDLSIKKVDNTVKYTAPSVTFSAEKADTVSPVVLPTVDTGDSVYYMYRYLLDGVPVDTGFSTAVPSYTVEDNFVGTLTIEVTPINSQGTYGETKTHSLLYEPQAIVNNGVSGLDEVLENKIINGTFENAMPTWTLSGLEITKEINETATNTSFTSAKLAGDGSVKINPTIYYNELYDAELYVKPVSGDVEVSLVADFGNKLTHTVFSETVSVGAWTKLTGNVLRFKGSYKNGAAETVSPVLTLTVSGDCYIDEFTLTPAENLLISSDDIRVMVENDGTEVGGWYIRGTATAEVVTDGVKVSNTNGINNCIAQYVVLDKNSTYTLTANLKATDASSDDKCTVYGAYSGAKYENVTISDGGVAFEKTIDLSTKNLPNVIASCVAFTDADMSVTNASLIKDLKYIAPEAATASIPAAVVQGNSVQGSAEAVFDDGDGVGYIYCYKLDGKNVGSGFAVNDTIPAITAPEPAGDTGELTLTVVPVNSEGTIGAAVTSQVCTVSGSYVATHSPVSSSSFTAGNTVSLGVNVANNTDEPQKIVVIAAYYEGGRMLSCDLVEKTITNGLNEDYELNVILPATNVNGGGTFNVFVWKGYDGNTFSMEPVCEVINPVTN